MHESEQRGKLLLNGLKMPENVLARLLGLDKQILTTTLTTLLTYGVVKVEKETGVLYSKRMVSDELLRQIRSEAGKLGGNPMLKQKPTPSSTSSSSSPSSLSPNGDTPTERPNQETTSTEGMPNNLSVEIAGVVNGQPKDPLPAPDERSKHPAIVAVRQITKKFPNKDLWDRIIKRFGESPDVSRLQECWLEWLECGYNKTSTKWLNWYFDGIPTRNGNGKIVITQSTNRKTARDYHAEIDAELR
jgi:hypothetical protein